MTSGNRDMTKETISPRLDADVVAGIRAATGTGKAFQAAVNTILRKHASGKNSMLAAVPDPIWRPRRVKVSLGVEPDVLTWFREHAPEGGYQRAVNAALRAGLPQSSPSSS